MPKGFVRPAGFVYHAGSVRVVLIGVTNLHGPPVRRVQPGRHIAAQALHQLPHIRLEDEHDLVKARPHRVVHTILHQYLSVGPHAVGLLAAAVAGTDPAAMMTSAACIVFPP